MPSFTRFAILLLAAVATLPAVAASDPAAEADPDVAILRDLQDGRLEAARARLDVELERRPHDETLLYLAATTASRLCDAAAGGNLLHRAVRAGFLDFEMIRHDPDLDGLRNTGMYRALLDAEPEFLRHRGPAPPLEGWYATYGRDGYRVERDARRRLTYVHALPEATATRMRRSLSALADHLSATLFEAPPGYHVLVAIPTPPHAARHFEGRDALGGVYEHEHRRLVARDVGSSLRHEFVHLMHFGDLDRRRQQHPIWLLEGIASLYEDVEIDDPARLARFTPNYRDDSARFLMEADRLPTLETLFALDQPAFMADPGRHYAAARSIMRHVAAQGLLVDFYHSYVAGFDEDPTGRAALESTLQRRLDGIEKQWRAWIASEPRAQYAVTLGSDGLGIEAEMRGSSVGVLVTDVEADSPAARAGLRAGDVIVAVDDRATPSYLELRGLVGRMRPGGWVPVRVRRNAEVTDLAMKLGGRRPK